MARRRGAHLTTPGRTGRRLQLAAARPGVPPLTCETTTLPGGTGLLLAGGSAHWVVDPDTVTALRRLLGVDHPAPDPHPTDEETPDGH